MMQHPVNNVQEKLNVFYGQTFNNRKSEKIAHLAAVRFTNTNMTNLPHRANYKVSLSLPSGHKVFLVFSVLLYWE